MDRMLKATAGPANDTDGHGWREWTNSLQSSVFSLSLTAFAFIRSISLISGKKLQLTSDGTEGHGWYAWVL